MAGYCAEREERPGGRNRRSRVGEGAQSEGAVGPDHHRADDDHSSLVRVELRDGVAPRPVTSDKGLISHLSFQAHNILSWGLERSFGDKLAITLSRNFVSVCNFMTVNDFYIRYGTLPHTFSHFCHTLGKLHTLWEV